MEFMTLDWIPLILVGLATLFLLGEVLVNMRGLFTFLGIIFITLYFNVYLETSSLILLLVVYFTGIVMIIIDGKFLNDGILSTIGMVIMLFSVALPTGNIVSGTYAVLGLLLGTGFSFFLLKIFKPRGMWNKVTLKDQLTSEAGYNSMNERYKELLDKEGLTLNDLRPVGDVRIGDKKFSAISNGKWVPKGTKIVVKQVDGTRILVEELNKS